VYPEMRIHTSTDASCRQTALDLLASGLWPVVIQPGEKRPIGLAWGSTRPVERSLSEVYWNTPGAGTGLLLGPRGLVIDVECDGPEGEESFRRLLDGRIITTCGWMSARGKHRLYRYDPELEVLGRSIVKSDDFPDLEIRIGLGGKQIQSVVPPTMGRKWNEFWWVDSLPKEVISKLREDPKPEHNGVVVPDSIRALKRAEHYLAACPPAISGQRGHNTTFKVTCHVGPGFGLEPEVCYQLLSLFYNPRCLPPWSEKELRHKVEDAYSIETRRGWLYER
jgi:Bifunctional DNA primase/polymerase, N-terminal